MKPLATAPTVAKARAKPPPIPGPLRHFDGLAKHARFWLSFVLEDSLPDRRRRERRSVVTAFIEADSIGEDETKSRKPMGNTESLTHYQAKSHRYRYRYRSPEYRSPDDDP